MNEHTEQNINEAIDWLQQTAGCIQDFATEQTPLYCQEVVAWTFWSGLVLTTAGVILLSVFIYCMKRISKEIRADGDENEYIIAPCVIGGIITLVGACALIGSGTHNMVKAKVAPRMVIFEHIQEIAR